MKIEITKLPSGKKVEKEILFSSCYTFNSNYISKYLKKRWLKEVIKHTEDIKTNKPISSYGYAWKLKEQIYKQLPEYKHYTILKNINNIKTKNSEINKLKIFFIKQREKEENNSKKNGILTEKKAIKYISQYIKDCPSLKILSGPNLYIYNKGIYHETDGIIFEKVISKENTIFYILRAIIEIKHNPRDIPKAMRQLDLRVPLKKSAGVKIKKNNTIIKMFFPKKVYYCSKFYQHNMKKNIEKWIITLPIKNIKKENDAYLESKLWHLRSSMILNSMGNISSDKILKHVMTPLGNIKKYKIFTIPK